MEYIRVTKENLEKEHICCAISNNKDIQVSSKKACILYYRGKVLGGICDDRLLVKPVPVAVKMMPDAEMEPPYDGAKKMILVDDVDNRQFLCELVESI